MPTPTSVYLALAAGYIIGRYHGRVRSYLFQNRGEARVARELARHFDGSDFHLMNHITLPIAGGSTQIDHLLVSRFGLFVIETKHYQGWIFANPKHSTWTQVFYGRKFRFQNPIRQNFLHVQTIQSLCDFLPPNAVKSVVVFSGKADFRIAVPEGVVMLGDLVDHIRQHTEELMTANRLQFCIGRIESQRMAVSRETDIQHVERLRRRYGH